MRRGRSSSRTTKPSSPLWSSRCAEAFERHGTGELDFHDVDEVIHRYTKAARALWKFCFLGGSGVDAERVAATLELLTAEGERPDWWAVARRPPCLTNAGSRSKSELLSGRDLVLGAGLAHG